VAGFPAVVSPLGVALGFATSFAVGVAAGLYPAIQASWMEPMDAMRT
jgi:ABC-type antimicrobial peptide transport system permease subunit